MDASLISWALSPVYLCLYLNVLPILPPLSGTVSVATVVDPDLAS